MYTNNFIQHGYKHIVGFNMFLWLWESSRPLHLILSLLLSKSLLRVVIKELFIFMINHSKTAYENDSGLVIYSFPRTYLLCLNFFYRLLGFLLSSVVSPIESCSRIISKIVLRLLIKWSKITYFGVRYLHLTSLYKCWMYASELRDIL